MTNENSVLNPIPMRTWRWLGVNEARLTEAIPAKEIGIYDKLPLAGELPGVWPIGALPAELEAYAAKIDAGASEESRQAAIEKANSGYYIEIAAGEKRAEPIELCYELDAANSSLADHHFIVARKNSEATILVIYTGVGESFHNGLTKVYAEAGAVVHLIKLQLLPDTAVHIDAIGTYAETGAKVEITTVELGAAQTITSLKANLAGDDSQADIQAIYFGDGRRKIDMNYVLRHEGKRTDGSMQVHGALLDQSEKIFRGTLDFIKGAKGSVGREAEEIVLLSPAVRNRSVPLMLAGEDDVDGHHAVSVGKMNEDKLFYLMSRGLSLRDAEKLVIEASFQPALDRLPNLMVKERISEYIRRRLTHVE